LFVLFNAVGWANAQPYRLTDSVSLEEVIVTGVVTPTSKEHALVNVRTISSEQIKALGAVTLDQAVSHQLLFSVVNDPILGPQFRLQGLGGDKIKILIDGVPVTGREAGNIDLSQFDLSNVERIEIVQGPMSIMYGSDALAGVLNIITKRMQNPKRKMQNQVGLNYETVGKYNISVKSSVSFGANSISVGVERNYFGGWKYLDTAAPHRLLLFKPKEQYPFSLSYSYTSPKGFSALLKNDYVQEKIWNLGAAQISPYEGYAFDDYYRNQRLNSRLILQKKSWQIVSGYSLYHRTKNSFRKDLVSLNQQAIPGMDDTSTFQEVSSRGTYSFERSRGALAVGYDANFQLGKSKKIPDGEKRMDDYAGFAMLDLFFLQKRLTVQTAFRGSYNSLFSSPLIPSVGISYKLSPEMNFKASYGKGFRAPSMKELYLSFIDQNHHVVGNPSLKAEVADHIQSSFLFEPVRRFSVLLTGYYNYVKHGIVLSADHPNDPNSLDYSYRNVTLFRNVVGSLEITGSLNQWRYTVGYAVTNTLAEKGSYESFVSQEATGSISYLFKKLKLNASVNNKWIGPQPYLLTNIDGTSSYVGKQPGYDMLGCSVSRGFFKEQLEVIIGGKNLLNVQQVKAAGISSGGSHSSNGEMNFLPRSLFITVGYKL